MADKEMVSIYSEGAMKLIYYMMAVDGEIQNEEAEKYDSIGRELMNFYEKNRSGIIKDCNTFLAQCKDKDKWFATLVEGAAKVIQDAPMGGTEFVPVRVLIWDLLTIAYSDKDYRPEEKKLLDVMVEMLGVDKAIYLELESSMLTIFDIEKELEWIKQTDRSYQTIETMVNELADRKNVILDSVHKLMTM